jgi:hypothetical protein
MKTLFAALTLGVVACASTDKNTQITLAITSETFPNELATVKTTIVAPDGQTQEYTYLTSPARVFPGTTAVIPAGERSLSAPLTIELRGYDGNGKEILKRRSRLGYVQGRNITIPMPLRMACLNQKCAANETCAGGTCVSENVDATTLRDFKESEVIGDLGAACFDEKKCISKGKVVPVTIVQRKRIPTVWDFDCTFDVPARANVSIRWAAAQDRLIVLDEGDAREGWIRTEPGRGKLAPGLCAAYAEQKPFASDPKPFSNEVRLVFDRAYDLAVSEECETKTGRLPFCQLEDASPVGAGSIWTDSPGEPDKTPRPISKVLDEP